MRLYAPHFSLTQTLHSGQLFRFEEKPEGFLVSHRNKAFLVQQEGDFLVVHACTPNVAPDWLSHFFGLDQELPVAVDAFSKEAIDYCGSMRICRQDPWECTVGFICSQNNNIKRIKQLMQGLAEHFGSKVIVGSYTAYLFPEPGSIVSGDALSSIRLGYREKYLVAVNSLTDEWLHTLYELPYDAAKDVLLTLSGVGPKVADCILLFAYGHKQAFPIDTWVAQIMKEQYGVDTKPAMVSKAKELFAQNAGVLQQYLFHYKRTKR